ncbi:MAG TPA: A/G-specific adenine glycosylase [Casimicrobiaceae bacterium]
MITWQRTHGRHDLPWQGTCDPYRIWLSEIMLQQTQVATVLPYYARFVVAFATVDALAAAPLSRVLELWSGLGYYRRAHHLHAAARIVVERHAGRFPVAAGTLATLPGIGRSTAAAIAAFASGARAAILDGNVKRVLARHRGIEGWPGEARVQAALWRAAEALLPRLRREPAASGPGTGRGDIAAYTQGLMDLGAAICTRTRPRCAACPVGDDCIALRDARIDELPSPRPRRELPRRAIGLLVLEHDGRILLEQRPPVGIWGGLWSLPEAPLGTNVATHVATRFGVIAGTPREMPPLTHAFTHFRLTMHPLRVPIATRPASLRAPGVEWFARDAALACALPSPIGRLLRSIGAAAPSALPVRGAADARVSVLGGEANPPRPASRRAGAHRRR